MALLSRARTVARTIEQDNCCPCCLLEFSEALVAEPDALDELRRGLHELWDACVTAIAVLAPEDENAAFRRSLRITVSRCSLHANSHNTAAKDEESDDIDLVHDFVDAACGCLHACLSVGERSAVSRAQKKHKAFSNKRGAWPMRQEDLFPSGADSEGAYSDVKNIIRWSMSVEKSNPALLLADMLFIAHPIVFPAVMAERDDLVESLADWIFNPAAVRMYTRVELPDMDAFARGDQKTAAAVAVMSSLRDAPDAEPNSFLVFTLDHEDNLFQAANIGIGVLTARHGPESELLGEVASLAAIMHTRLAQPDSVACSAVRARLPKKTSDLDLAGVLHVLIQTLAARRRICAGPNCGLSVHASDDPNTVFSRCSRCKLVQYCSKACQRDDWKTGRGIQHKLACQVFCEILSRSGVDLPLDEFQRKLASLSQNPQAQYELSLFACSHQRALPMEVVVRAGQIHREAALVLGWPNVISGANSDMEYMDRVFRRQERWASRFPSF
ncbi:hypothetical protein AURDEDRAFT_188833 [Auricularia subglabra TFB-10046 SS5]|uniref:MYND-type domain-containing protein n=1 Tax=Auricularia subglabra (strain TFB-10046 / SS5) TaxID=717982 RepID=J0CWU3_AURST|nr:hypothetical protein AURDEDRAFT_188833 [Auricularia subglabra TFB-10046 SS5]